MKINKLKFFQGAAIGSIIILVALGIKIVTKNPSFINSASKNIFSTITLSLPLLTIIPTPTSGFPPTFNSTSPKTLKLASQKSNPECITFSAHPTVGGAELSVVFTGSAIDHYGKIVAFEFNFGGECEIESDSCKNAQRGDLISRCEVEKEVGEIGSHALTCKYKNPGSYKAFVKMKDNDGNLTEVSEACRQKIEVQGMVLGARKT